MLKIKCCFDVTNEYIKKSIPCVIDIVEENSVEYTYVNKEKVNEIDYNNEFQFCTGYLKEDNIPIPNAIIYFMKNNKEKNIEQINDGINGIKNAERNNTFEKNNNTSIIVEKCITDENGKYYAYIENGIYDIKIDCGDYKDIQNNVEIKDGIIGEKYWIIKSLINKRIGRSTFKMNNTNSKLIKLNLLNEHNQFTNGDLIITKDDEILIYKKINKQSMFMLDNDIYDIRIRNNNTNIKIIKDFEFNENEDFIEKLMRYL